jgi:hypothetical protein
MTKRYSKEVQYEKPRSVTKLFVLLILADLLYGNLKTKRGKLAMFGFVCVLFFVLFVASSVSAEVFKCVGKKGEDLYQNFPCQFEWMGGMPMDVLGPKKSSVDAPGSKKSVADVPSPKKLPAAPAEPRLGMTTEEVRAIWGEPKDTVQEEPGDGGRFEVWSYDVSRSVRFDRKGRVSAVQK